MSKPQRPTITGIIMTTRNGLGFLPHPDGSEDIRIEQGHLNTALHGDTVEVSLLPRHKGGQQEGEVLQVLRRAKTKFVGVIEREGGLWYLVPDDRKMYTDIALPDAKEVKANYKAVVELTTWTDPKKDPLGNIIKVLGKKGEHEVEIASIVISHNIDTDFPKPVVHEARSIQKTWNTSGKNYIEDAIASGARRDFRNTPTFTIDPDTAKDFDDALSVEPKGGDRCEVGIHIADVSHYVLPNTNLDQEAEERGFSVYLVDRTIPMLPHELSNDLCSLNPNVPRLAFSTVFTIDIHGKIHDRWFGKSVIHSDKRFTYEEAQEIITTKRGPFFTELKTLNTLKDILMRDRFNKGAIDFEQREVEIKIDERGKPTTISRKDRLDTHKLVEEFMLLANREVAEYLHNAYRKASVAGGPIYRVHDLPDQDKLKEITSLVRGLGYQFGHEKQEIHAKDINNLFAQIEGSPIEDLIKTAVIRSMSKAIYATKNIGHFGLGFKYYTHFTSPIRRYSDLLIHRILQKHINGKRVNSQELERYRLVAQALSNKEAEIQKAERESITYKQVEYMAQRIGKTFNGVITGVTEWGIYIEEMESGAEGMVRIRDLTNDYYLLEEKKYRIKGEKTGTTHTLGDRVRFKVTGADIDKKTLDFVLVS